MFTTRRLPTLALLLVLTLLFSFPTLSTSQVLPPIPVLPENPLAAAVVAARAFAAAAPPLANDSGLRRADYLTTISGVIHFWVPFQNASGAIIDPAAQEEKEYSTPCFAHAAATLAVNGHPEYLSSATAGLTWSLHSLATQNCATASCDFYAMPVMRTYELLLPTASVADIAIWNASLQAIDYHTYEITGNNWELTAAAGEYDRLILKNFGSGTNLNWTFWESRIGRLATVRGNSAFGFWSGEGIFNDNTGAPVTSPMAYDAFATAYVAVLLAEGYNSTGYYAPYLTPIMERGVWTHALYQSPLGEQPVGGRSNQHQFAEATLAAVAELYAGKAYAAGDSIGACQLQRAARLYHSSVRRWQREDGALQILKNWYLNYTERYGYMSYSFFSNYNLLPVSWLSVAFASASQTDAIPECPTLSDVGGVAFALESPRMRKVFGAVSGTYVELMTGADPAYDASGFNRFHFDRCATVGAPMPCRLLGLLGPSQAPGIEGNSQVSSHAGTTTGGLSLGATWSFVGEAPGTRHSLSNNTIDTILAAIVTTGLDNSPVNGVSFKVQYVLWSEGVLVEENYFMPPQGGIVNITSSISLPGPSQLFRIMKEGSITRDGVHVFYSPPVDKVLAAAVFEEEEEEFFKIAPPFTSTATTSTFAVMGIAFPAFSYDGTTNFTITQPGAWAPDAVLVQSPIGSPGSTDPRNGALAFHIVPPPGRNITWTFDPSISIPSRNGAVTPVYADVTTITSNNPTISYSIQVVARS